ncbi:PTS system IIB component, Glc family /PTS system IIC component, Glc family [Clostridium amylolyticum]|uniref:PTS system IIB component, Glc family /PTS system IIC component, Glc family n=1 Tax=Clostridium amylolyticum TaxID=1121298 RepID=A0A1M6EM34_9CLOT|nr:PTS transporter subunit EIIC [Clostridium amylolyticum]SHI86504.1 PTS system IIB component, Glc family /PTS system IIC component, Glc family [Clostridium amylolyticum]
MSKDFSQKIQRFGRTLLLPIAVMAPVGMILGITGALVQSYMIARFPFLGNTVLNTILVNLRTIAGAVFDNIPLMFAMGVAYGMSKKDKGISVFASVIGYIILIITMNAWLVVTGKLADPAVMSQYGQIKVLGIQTMNINALGGIITGLVAAWVTDRFYKLELPIAFAFFSGKKSVPIITMGIMLVIGLVIPFIWEVFVSLLTKLSVVFLSPVGPFFTAAGERLFIPFGLHHLWNALFRFTEAGGSYVIDGQTFVGVVPTLNHVLFKLGPSSEHWSMMPSLTRFMAQQQMLCTLFAFPAIGLAMYKTSYKENKPLVKSLMITCILTALLGNVTEPLEFSFVFIAPLLYAAYAVIIGVGAVALSLANVGIGYIRGTIFDFAIFGLLYEKTNWVSFIIIGLILAVVTYFVFKWAILKFDLKTPGREDSPSLDNSLIREKKYDEIAKIVVQALGGKPNIKNVDNCITRLRIDLEDVKLVDRKLLETSGCTGIFFPASKHIHIVYGPLVEFVRNEVDEELQRL